MSEMLIGTLEPAARQLGLTQVFVGVILIALIGNAAEHSTAVIVAIKNKMDLAYGIAVGSSLQIALLVAPLLVFASYFLRAPLDLIFTPFEVVAVTVSVLIVGFVAMDRESNWMEGVMLVGAYLMLAIAFFFLPACCVPVAVDVPANETSAFPRRFFATCKSRFRMSRLSRKSCFSRAAIGSRIYPCR